MRRLLLVSYLVTTGPLLRAAGAQSLLAGEEPVGAIELDQAIALAVERSPELAVAELDLEAAGARREQAGLRPNPDVALEFENVDWDLPGASRSEITVLLSQRLELGGKRGARVAHAESLANVVRWDRDLVRRDLIREVKVAFSSGLGAQERVAVAEETLALAREVAASVDQKVATGAISPVETTRARVAVARSGVDLEAARRELDLARRLLALHWGSPAPGFASLAGELDTLATIPERYSLTASLARNPDVARWGDEARARGARLRLERSLAVPDLSLGGGIRRLEESGQNTLLFGVGIPLPLFDRNQGAVREAVVAMEQASRAGTGARWRAERALIAVVTRLEIAQSAVRGLRTAVIPGAQASFDEIRRGYELGQFTYLDVLEARQSLAEARAAEIDALVDLALARAEIESLTGGSF
jgi:cobalt-zinc-cadmium efflux system outer membrane protein